MGTYCGTAEDCSMVYLSIAKPSAMDPVSFSNFAVSLFM